MGLGSGVRDPGSRGQKTGSRIRIRNTDFLFFLGIQPRPCAVLLPAAGQPAVWGAHWQEDQLLERLHRGGRHLLRSQHHWRPLSVQRHRAPRRNLDYVRQFHSQGRGARNNNLTQMIYVIPGGTRYRTLRALLTGIDCTIFEICAKFILTNFDGIWANILGQNWAKNNIFTWPFSGNLFCLTKFW